MTKQDTTPRYEAGSFACPHCGANCQQDWFSCRAVAREGEGDALDPGIAVSVCFVCGDQTIWNLRMTRGWGGQIDQTGDIIWPVTSGTGPDRNTDMPPEVAALYEEASSIASLSPRSASALLRLGLELLLEDLYPAKKGNLNAMIAEGVKAGLPEQVQKTMDVMRFSGNENVHAFQPDDSAADASTLFGLLNYVVERLISQPKQLDALYEGLPENFKDSVAKRDTPKE